MAVGSQPSEGGINQTLTQLALAIREWAQDAVEQRAYLNKLGLAQLEALGFTATDAQSVLNMINYMGTVADVYHGTATQATAFNFEDALTPLWGGS